MTSKAGPQEMGGMGRHSTVGSSQWGMAYLALLIVVAGIGIGLAAVGTLWQNTGQREKERELLFVGEQFRKAIRQYYEGSPGIKRYPMRLEDLLQDSRYPGIRRHLRQIYADPLMSRAQWGLVRAPDGGVMGVYSLADGAPIKQGSFKAGQANFEGKTGYAGWQFVYVPVGTQVVVVSGSTGLRQAKAR